MTFEKAVLQIKAHKAVLTQFFSNQEDSRLLSKLMYLILLETSGNQRYIFSTNKLRENVGASELTYRIGTKAIEEAVKEIDGRNFLVSEISKEEPIEATENKIEVIIATSGKALLLVKEDLESKDKKSIAKKIVSFVTKKALIEMPGLTIHGAISEEIKDDTAETLHKALGEVHNKLEKIRYQIPSNLQRFQRIPFVTECNTTNLPAKELYLHESLRIKKVEEEKPHSIVSIFKQEALKSGKERLEQTIRNIKPEVFKFDTESGEKDFAKNPHRLDIEERFKDTKWFAVIHADGNGLGQLFLNFQKETGVEKARDYIEKYRKFSLELDKCCVNAVAFALEKLQKAYFENLSDKSKDSRKAAVPAIPLILGGDDLTIIVDGEYAVKFTKDFLTQFVEKTKEIKGIFKEEKKLGICAGIAIIKPHFPFHQAYALAAELLQSAKKVKNISTSLSAFDYHVLYDSSGTTLEEIRKKTPFVARPYIVSENTENIDQSDEHKTWVKNHHFRELAKRVNAMTKKDEDEKNKLPNSQLHILREGLFIGEDETEARADLIAHRYKDKGFIDLLCEDGKLFFQDNLDGNPNRSTHLLDAMDIVELWKGGETHK